MSAPCFSPKELFSAEGREKKKCEQDFTNLAYGRATAEAENDSVATNYGTEYHSAHNDTSAFETVQYASQV